MNHLLTIQGLAREEIEPPWRGLALWCDVTQDWLD